MRRINTARLSRGGMRIADINFVWNEAGYRKMQRQPSILAYMEARAEMVANEMRRLTSGPVRSKDQYRNNRFSDSYNIGSSRGDKPLHSSIEARFTNIGSRDFPFSYNIGPYRYRGPNDLTGLENINIVRFGNSRGQSGRDFIKDAVRNVLGSDLD